MDGWVVGRMSGWVGVLRMSRGRAGPAGVAVVPLTIVLFNKTI